MAMLSPERKLLLVGTNERHDSPQSHDQPAVDWNLLKDPFLRVSRILHFLSWHQLMYASQNTIELFAALKRAYYRGPPVEHFATNTI